MRRSIVLGCLLVLACSSQDSRFAQIEERFSRVEQRFAAIDTRFSALTQRFAAFDAHSSAVQERFAAIDTRFSALAQQLVPYKDPHLPSRKKGAEYKNAETAEHASTTPSTEPDTKTASHTPDPLTALQVLRNTPSLTTATCTWDLDIRPISATEGAVFMSIGNIHCLHSLKKAGLIQWKEQPPRYWREWGESLNHDVESTLYVITPLKGARISKSKLAFDCGKIEIDSIVSMTPHTSSANVKYERTTTIDTALTSKLTTCRLNIPKRGKSSDFYEMDRNPQGEWVSSPSSGH